MLFAAMIDAGLIPFLIFTALISHTQSIESVNSPGHWSTLLDNAATGIVFATFVTSVVTGTFHLLSLAISIYLGVIFRKISRLPPDMNPLEDNLTSRHKRNKSSLLDNRMSQNSAETDKFRESKAEDPLMASPTIPFMHTRNDSHSNITNISHSSASARASRINLSVPFYDQPPAHRSSRTEIRGPFYDLPLSQHSSRTKIQSLNNDQPRSPRSDPHCDTTSAPHLNIGDRVSRTDFFRDQHSPPQWSPRHAREKSPSNPTGQPAILRSPTKSSSIYSDVAKPAEQTNQATILRSPTKSSSIYSTSTITTIATSRPASTRPRSIAPSLPDDNWITHPSPSPSPSPSPPRELKHLLSKPSYQPLAQTSPFEYTTDKENFRPLEMNPPTPPLNSQKRRAGPGVKQRALALGAGNHGQGGDWNPGMVGFGKAKAWGGMGRSKPVMGGGGRVVSRSGVEVKERGIFPSGGIRAREVSGKVMEEGRTGTGGWM